MDAQRKAACRPLLVKVPYRLFAASGPVLDIIYGDRFVMPLLVAAAAGPFDVRYPTPRDLRRRAEFPRRSQSSMRMRPETGRDI